MPNSLIEERDERTRKRKKIKRKMDSIIGLSYYDEEHKVMTLSVNGTLGDESIRLLDEGFCDNGFVLKKGTLEKFLNGQNQYVRGWRLGEDGWERTEVLNLSDDFVGTINLGHMDFATFPYLLGSWTKSDLSLVDIENDRKALNIRKTYDEESVFVQELKRQDYDIGVSAEFWYHVNDADTENLSEMLNAYIPVIDEIFIFAYALVGECGNVNSSGLELANSKGVNMEDIREDINTEEVEEMTLSADTADEEITEPTEPIENNEQTDETEEPMELAEEDESEEVEVEEAEEEFSDEDEDEEAEGSADELEEALTLINELRGSIATLQDTVCELKKANRRLQGKLKNEKEKKEKFLANAKSISVALLPNEGEDEVEKPQNEKIAEQKRGYLYGDGIGEK